MYNYPEFVFFLQERKFSAHVWTANLIVHIRHLQQRNNQLVPELIVYLNKLEFQMTPPTKTDSAEIICFVLCTNTFDIQSSIKANLGKPRSN